MIAASAGRYQIILMLIRNGAQVNAVNQTGQCSLHYAASKNRYEVRVQTKQDSLNSIYITIRNNLVVVSFVLVLFRSFVREFVVLRYNGVTN